MLAARRDSFLTVYNSRNKHHHPLLKRLLFHLFNFKLAPRPFFPPSIMLPPPVNLEANFCALFCGYFLNNPKQLCHILKLEVEAS